VRERETYERERQREIEWERIEECALKSFKMRYNEKCSLEGQHMQMAFGLTLINIFEKIHFSQIDKEAIYKIYYYFRIT
jgi:hypothetical protein